MLVVLLMVGSGITGGIIATDNRDRKASWSNYGPWCDMAAPGDNVFSTWVNNGKARDWSEISAEEFLAASTEVKTVWVPYGE